MRGYRRSAPLELNLSRRAAFLIIFDIFACFAAFSLAYFLTGQYIALLTDTDAFFVMALFAVVNVFVYGFFHLYTSLFEFANFNTLTQVLIAVTVATLIAAFISFAFFIRFPIRVLAVGYVLELLLVGGVRLLFRYYYRHNKSRLELAPKSERPRTMIVGAGETGAMCINRMLTGDYAMQGIPILAVDDDPHKQGMRISGVKVMGNRHDILKLVHDYDIEQIVVAILSGTRANRREIFTICAETHCKLLTLPDVKDLSVEEIGDIALREVNLSDLLGRKEIELDNQIAESYLRDKTVLITGAGGSIGSELVRQLIAVKPKKLVFFDIYENGVFDLRGEILEKHPECNIAIEIGSIRDKERLEEVFSSHMPHVVFHAAAHKHVPLMEVNPREALKNNVYGTLNTVEAAIAHKVERFIFISTDKAVNPANVMGASKRMGEMIIQAYNSTSDTLFAAVRFGNVLGSHGSVIPIFKRQIKEGGPITVTHPDIVRYFMTIPEAARLIIHAGGMANGGEIFILNMGEPVKIVDLAKNMLKLSGLVEGRDIDIVYTGLRPGEKLFEELLNTGETTRPTDNKDIMISKAKTPDFTVLQENLAYLKAYTHKSNAEVKTALEHCVPTYTHQDIELQSK